MATDIDTIKALYEDFSSVDLKSLSALYAQDAKFSDPIHALQGVSAINQYFEASRCGLKHCHFEFTLCLQESNHISLEWVMHFSHQRLKNGNTISIPGCSMITLNKNGLISSHRDYYDLGAMLYEHVGLLGTVVRFIKAKVGK